jgi:hypothetical protein
MVAKPPVPHLLAADPRPAGALIEASFALWLQSWRPALGVSLLYGLANLLPGLTLGDLTSRLLRGLLADALEPYRRWLPKGLSSSDEGWIQAALEWACRPSTWTLLSLSLLLSLAALTGLIHVQQRVAEEGDRARSLAWGLALRRLPAGLGAWLVYLALLVALTLPYLGVTLLAFGWSANADVGQLVILLLAYLAGSVLLLIPLAWAAVAAGFAPFASVIDGVGPLRAQGLSITRIRGHWLHAAIVISIPMLIWLGAGGLISSLIMLICGGIAYVSGGLPEILRGTWLLWAQAVSLLPQAILLPLATAGGVLAWHDLGQRIPVATAPVATKLPNRTA